MKHVFTILLLSVKYPDKILATFRRCDALKRNREKRCAMCQRLINNFGNGVNGSAATAFQLAHNFAYHSLGVSTIRPRWRPRQRRAPSL
jgi:Zn-dependent alcohol dehydrogenase